MKEDRFLTAILIGIGLLAILALSLFFLRQNQVDYLPEETPESILNNYALALYKGDYERAYQYLAEDPNKPDFARFRQAFVSGQMSLNSAGLKVGEAQIENDEALVTVTVLQSGGGPFGEVYRNPSTAALKRQSGSWKITSLPYPFFSWDWLQPLTEEAKPPPVGN